MITFILNDKTIQTDLPNGTVLLDYLRKHQRLTGTKEGCREGDCGACTVLVGELVDEQINYKTVNSCLYPLGDAHLKHIVTIEGLNQRELNFLQSEFVNQGGTQCGFCTPGFVISAISYFIIQKNYNIHDAINFIGGNICRCTGYMGIKRALINTIDYLNSTIKKDDPLRSKIEKLVELKFLPAYFKDVVEKLKRLIKNAGLVRGEGEIIVSGGTDLYVQKWEDLVDKDIRLLSRMKGIKGIQIQGNEICIGGATTISEIENSDILNECLPELNQFLKLFGSVQIRNRATIGGNIVNASPIADLVNILLVFDAKIHLYDGEKNRTIPIRNFYKGYKQLDKNDNEIVYEISFHKPEKNYLFNFEKVSRRTYLDIASVNSAFFGYVDDDVIIDINISAGGVAPIPLFLEKTSSFLKGKKIGQDSINESIEIAMREISPISDARGSKEYKSLLLRQLILAHLEKFFPEIVSLDLINVYN